MKRLLALSLRKMEQLFEFKLLDFQHTETVPQIPMKNIKFSDHGTETFATPREARQRLQTDKTTLNTR